MKNILKFVLLMAAALVVAVSGPAVQGVRQILAAAPVEPVQNEPPAKLVIDPPLAESLSHGRVVIQYRAEHLHLVPVFGPPPWLCRRASAIFMSRSTTLRGSGPTPVESP